jgi:hypothetical protein
MKKTRLKYIAISLFVWFITVQMSGMNAQIHKFSLNSNNVIWNLKAEAELQPSDQIYESAFNVDKWVKATVPGTVFGSYVEQGLEKDPNYADNIYKVDRNKYDRNFWYRTSFTLPAEYQKGKIWLKFEGVNRKGEIYFNGTRLGLLDGFMYRGAFEISALIQKNKPNVLAVLIHCPKLPIPNYSSPTYISSDGWDWMPSVPGLLSGITDDVYITTSGEVTIEDPWIRTDLPSNEVADLSLSVELKNNSAKDLTGFLTGEIMPGNVIFSKKVDLKSNQSQRIELSKKEFPQLTILNPNLWWPNGYGEPNLYSCNLKFNSDSVVLSDQKVINFGIRKFTYDTIGSVFHISVNGTRIFVKGGNWGMSEYMLRCRGEEYNTKVRLHKEMNFNMIRNWIGSTTDDEFYQACDKNGIMVWDDFWLNSHRNLPTDVFAFNKNAVEKILRLRNHACVAVWCGDNEGYPMAPLNAWLREDVKTFDGNDRWYQPNSHSDALTGSGVWTNMEPKSYFTYWPLGFGGNKGWGFRTEIGTAVFTTFESFKEFMPESTWWPRNEMWDKHFFGPSAGNASPDIYTKSITTSYGKAKGIEDFCKKAQLLNIETNKALYEGWVDHIGNDASGILDWMSQSAYPSFVWQTYDYYYDLTGAYWGAKKGCEPVHILWNCSDNSIDVTNTTNEDISNLTAEAKIYNMNGSEVKALHNMKIVDVQKNTAKHCFTLKFETDENLALKKLTFASSIFKESANTSAVTDGDQSSRWSSENTDNEWVAVDLGKSTEFNAVELDWEAAYAKSYKLQISNDSVSWTDLYTTDKCEGGRDLISFAPVKARFVKMTGLKRAIEWGYSLWEFKVFMQKPNLNDKDKLSDVHFIKLTLKDNKGKIVSDNFYWRGNKYLDYTGLNTLPEVKLNTSVQSFKKNGKCYVDVKVKNPGSAPAVAFAVRLQLVDGITDKRILPLFMTDNYFSLLKGETKIVRLEFDAALLPSGVAKLIIAPYANKNSAVLNVYFDK